MFGLTVLVAALVVCFCLAGVAQDRPAPTATIGEQVARHPQPGTLKSPFNLLQKGAPLQPTYCSPCYFYGGDSNPSNPNANGLWDNNSSGFNTNGVIYTPFVVTKPPKCGGVCDVGITGIGGNIEMNPSPPVLNDVAWSIVTGVATGGTPASTTVICSGTDTAPTLTDTGRLFFGFYEEWNVTASTGGTCPGLEPGKKGAPAIYWQTNQVETSGFQLAYESNVPDVPPPNAFGNPEPVDDSFFYAPAFGFNTFANANGLGAFHVFSTDLEGGTTK
jgi:hypothetical protein